MAVVLAPVTLAFALPLPGGFGAMTDFPEINQRGVSEAVVIVP